MAEYLRRRRALFVGVDRSTNAETQTALTTYGFDVFENLNPETVPADVGACEPDVVIVVIPSSCKRAGELLELVGALQHHQASRRAPVLVVAPESDVDHTAALLSATGGLVLPEPAQPLEIVLGARRLARELLAVR